MSDSPVPSADKPLPPRSAKAASLSTSLWSVGLGIAVLAGLYVVNATFFPGKGVEKGKDAVSGTDSAVGNSPPTPAIASSGNPSVVDPEADAKKQRDDRAAREKLDREQAAARLIPIRARLAALKADGDDVKEALTRFDTLVAVWKTKYEPLRTDEAGKRIAASPSHLASAATVFGRDRATARQRAGWGEQLDQLLAPVLEAERDPNTTVVVHDDTLALTTKLLATVRAAVKGLESDTAVLDVARAATASMTPSANTLALAFEQRLADERAAELKTVEETRVAAVKKQTEELGVIEQKKIDAATAIKKTAALAELRKVEHEKQQAELAHKAAEDKRKADLAKAKLLTEYEADLPTIKLTLPAFITSGKTHRQKASNGPMSLAYIQGKGALEDSRKGLTEFCTLARQIGDRPQGPIPTHMGGDFGWDRLDKDAARKAQGLVVKYGAIMVEKGLLDP